MSTTMCSMGFGAAAHLPTVSRLPEIREVNSQEVRRAASASSQDWPLVVASDVLASALMGVFPAPVSVEEQPRSPSDPAPNVSASTPRPLRPQTAKTSMHVGPVAYTIRGHL